MEVCTRCLLSDNMPFVQISGSGMCNYCSAAAKRQIEDSETDYEFVKALDQNKHRRYQVAMAFSGGKDSTYTLKMIREKYDVSILAISFNNGFLSESSLKNIITVTDNLGVDSLIIKYPVCSLIKAFKFVQNGNIFPETSLERASAICNLCIMLIKNMVYYEAIVRNIPIICFGWTPGQVETVKPLIKLDYRMILKVFNNTRKAITEGLNREYDRYFLNEEFLSENKDRIPYIYYPFVKNAYCEEKIFDEIRQIGWESPKNTDGNSSNCLLNSYANQCHIDRFGYHPYAFEISTMIRYGYMTREEGAAKLEKVKNDSSFDLIAKRFQVT